MTPHPLGPPRRMLGLWIRAAIVLLAACQAFQIGTGLFSERDTENVETPLALAAAGQFRVGPRRIYGPYSRENPWVLVHPPLYYRLTGLLAWPAFVLGMPPVRASLLAGRLISFASFLALLVLVFRLARLDGSPVLAGTSAVLLVVSCHVIGSYPATVRPDILAVSLQTLGLYLVLKVVIDERSQGRGLLTAGIAFGLAFCLKQHDLVIGCVATLQLALVWRRRKVLRRPIERAFLAGLAVALAYYLAEEVWTSGGVSRAVFRLPLDFRRTSPRNDFRFLLFETLIRSSSLLALGAGCFLAGVGSPRGHRLDMTVLLYAAMELAATAVLGAGSTGAWVNYAIQGVVLVSILVGRMLGRLDSAHVSTLPLTFLAMIALGLVGLEFRNCLARSRARANDSAVVDYLMKHPRIGGGVPGSVYFAALPDLNRLHGREELAHDEWLYGLFERVGSAEPRSRWLRDALTRGPIRSVVLPRDPYFALPLDPPLLPGLSETLPELGYRRLGVAGRYFIWARGRTFPGRR